MLIQRVLLSHKGQTQSPHLHQEPLVKSRKRCSPAMPSLPLALQCKLLELFGSIIQQTVDPDQWRAQIQKPLESNLPPATPLVKAGYSSTSISLRHNCSHIPGTATGAVVSPLPLIRPRALPHHFSVQSSLRQNMSLVCWSSTMLRASWTPWIICSTGKMPLWGAQLEQTTQLAATDCSAACTSSCWRAVQRNEGQRRPGHVQMGQKRSRSQLLLAGDVTAGI